MNLVRTISSGPIKTNNDNSLIHDINGSRYPDINALFWIGKMMRVILFHHGICCMTAASSISPDSCIIAFSDDLEEKGIYLIVPTITQVHKAGHHNDPTATFMEVASKKNTKDKEIDGIKYGKKANPLTKFANLDFLFLLTA